MMDIGVPKESMTGENRVALTPGDCATLTRAGSRIHVESDAGRGSGYCDDDYREAGCIIADSTADLYREGELIVKVKQPLEHDFEHLRADHTVFSYMHLAADHDLIDVLCKLGLTAIPFESITDDDGRLPLLAPMSAIAGRIAAIRGASLLFRNRGGRGILLGGTQLEHGEGIENGSVVIIGAGVAGSHAAVTALALGADVTVLDLDEHKLRQLQALQPGLVTAISHADTIDAHCAEADLVIGAVLLAGRRAPVVLRRHTIEHMRAGSVIIDIAIDQGGCVENIHATDSDTLYYVQHGIIHSAVPNMPATVARTASQALSTAITAYVQKLANGHDTTSLAQATAISQGKIVDHILAEEYRHP